MPITSDVKVTGRRCAANLIALALLLVHVPVVAEDNRSLAACRVAIAERESFQITVMPKPSKINGRDCYSQPKKPAQKVGPKAPTVVAQLSGPDAAGAPEAAAPAGQTRRSVKQDTEEILVQEGGVLVPRGTLILEPSLSYVHIQNNRLAVKGYSIFNAILFGRFDVEKVRRNVLTTTLTARYGITNRMQAEFFVPYVYRTEEMIIPASIVTDEGNQSASVNDRGIGDIGGSVSYHAILSRGKIPDITFNVRFKSRTGKNPFDLDTQKIAGRDFPQALPTGTGFYGMSGGFTAVKVSDPVVFFGSLAYNWNLERNYHQLGPINPGNSIEYHLGMATALSEKTSLSFSFQNAFLKPTTVSGIEIPDSKLISASLSLGVNYRVSQRYSLFGSLNVGLTEDTPDFQVQLNLPFNFKLF